MRAWGEHLHAVSAPQRGGTSSRLRVAAGRPSRNDTEPDSLLPKIGNLSIIPYEWHDFLVSSYLARCMTYWNVGEFRITRSAEDVRICENSGKCDVHTSLWHVLRVTKATGSPYVVATSSHSVRSIRFSVDGRPQRPCSRSGRMPHRSSMHIVEWIRTPCSRERECRPRFTASRLRARSAVGAFRNHGSHDERSRNGKRGMVLPRGLFTKGH